MNRLKWVKTGAGYEAVDAVTSSAFRINRLIRRGNVTRWELVVEGERYGGEGTLRDKKEAAEYLVEGRLSRSH